MISVLNDDALERRAVIEERFGGNEDEYWSAHRWARKSVIHYDDLMNYETILPERTKNAKKIIYAFLGYNPPFRVVVKYEHLVRQAFDQYMKKEIVEQDFMVHSLRHCQKIRNYDMERGHWISMEKVEQEFLDWYMTENALFAQPARERLAGFLGYYPDLVYSLGAEMMMRTYLADDGFNPGWPKVAADYKAMTVVKYREALFQQGKEAADDLWPIGMLEDVDIINV